MPFLSASSQSNARAVERVTTAALMTWLTCLAGLSSVGCRDTREDTNYCSSCASSENADGTAIGSQEGTPPSSESNGTSTAPDSSDGGKTPTSTTPSNQAGRGNGSQAASAAVANGGASAISGSSSGPVAGTRGQQAGTAAGGGSGGRNSSQLDAGNGDNGRQDAGSQEPMQQPEPTPDAGQMPVLPCNGACPNERPVCDESKAVPQCVQCTAEEQFACIGNTSTCDVAQQKCVQCTPQDARNCAEETPVCNKDNRCVACTNDVPTSCPPAQSLCDNEQRCVECMPGRTEHCPPDRSMCNADGRCVACMDNAQCLEPALPRCDTGTNSCVGCAGASDCNSRFPNLPHCDAETKACVACSPTGDLCPVGEYCERYQCVPKAPKRRNCERCSTQAECADSPSIAACIEHDNDRFCFAATPTAVPFCEQGYEATRVPSHPNAMYCMPFSTMSCTAINYAQANKACGDPAECGKGGVCQMPDNVCRQSCTRSQECPAPLYCDQPAEVCKRP